MSSLCVRPQDTINLINTDVNFDEILSELFFVTVTVYINN